MYNHFFIINFIIGYMCISYLGVVFQYRYFYILNPLVRSLVKNYKWSLKDTNINRV